jgi:hypothetical protein
MGEAYRALRNVGRIHPGDGNLGKKETDHQVRPSARCGSSSLKYRRYLAAAAEDLKTCENATRDDQESASQAWLLVRCRPNPNRIPRVLHSSDRGLRSVPQNARSRQVPSRRVRPLPGSRRLGCFGLDDSHRSAIRVNP